MEDEDNYESLSIADRLVHKSWKARQSAYDDLAKEFRKATTGKDALFREYFDDMRKSPLEANAAALDTSLSALLSYLECVDAKEAIRMRSMVMPSLIEKGLGATRAPTKAKALDIILEYVALDTGEPITTELSSFMTHKQPKIVAASINALTEIVKYYPIFDALNCFRNFGAHNAGVKAILKMIPPMFAHADKNVRQEASTLVVEMARWIGGAINICFEGLKPVQVKELQEQIAKLSGAEAPRQLRWRRSEKPAEPVAIPSTMATEEASMAMEVDSVPNEALDAYSLSDPVNVLEKVPANFQENMESSKWKDRKDALDALLSVVKVPKIEPGHFGPLVGMLVKRLGDVNVMVVVVAAQCLEALCQGLRKGMSPHRNEIIPAALERCKEKNKSVVEALKTLLDAMVYCLVSVSEVMDMAAPFLAHKNPQVKAETAGWIARCIPSIFKAPQAKKEIKAVTDALVPCMDDGVADVREAAASALSAILRVGGEKQVLPFLEKLDKIKLTKVTDGAKAAASPAATQAPSVSTSSVSASAAKPVAAPATTQQQPQPPSATHATVQPKAAAAPKPAPAPKAAKTKTLDNLEFIRNDSESLNVMTGCFGEELTSSLNDSNWKTRMESIETICSRFEVVFPAEVDGEILARFLAQKPGWKESNVMIYGKMISLLMAFTEKYAFSHEAASIVIAGIIEKISDAKLGNPINNLLTCMAERVGLGFVVECLGEALKSQKNPKVPTETCNWIATALIEFGIQGVDLKKLSITLKSSMANANVAVRGAAIKAAVSLRRFAGSDTKALFMDLPPAQATTLDAEFAKVASDPIPVPSRKVKMADSGLVSTVATTGVAIPNEMDGGKTEEAASMEELIPRADVTSSLSALTGELGDANWKVRKEALDKAQNILASSGNRIKLTSVDFLSELRARYADSNRNLAIQALDLTAAIASAMNAANCEKMVKIFLSQAIACLSDNKPQVRTAVIKLLSALLPACSLSSMSGAMATALVGDSPNLRKDLLSWLAADGNCATLCRCVDEDRNALLLSAINCLQDRSADVRKAASAFLDGSIDYCPRDCLLRLCQSQKAALLAQVKQIVDSHVVKAPIIATATTATPSESSERSIPMSQIQPSTTSNAKTGGAPRTPKKTEATTLAAAASTSSEIFINSDPLAKVMRMDAESKGIKWSFDSPRVEFCEQLKASMQGCLQPTIIKLLFSDDFKDALNGLTVIDNALVKATTNTTNATSTSSAGEKDGILANTDLLLKYFTIRLFDTNTTTLIKSFDMLEHLLAVIDEANLRLNEMEAMAFFPHFVIRAGELKEPIRGRLRGIYRQLCRVYPASKIFSFLMDGLKAKSSRTRCECLAEMEVLIGRNGMMVLQAAKHVPLVAAAISDRDSQVRRAALNVLVQIHELIGEAIYKHLQGIPPKDLDAFNERLRRSKEKRGADEMEVDEEPTDDNQCSQSQSQQPQSTTQPHQQQCQNEDVPVVFSLDPAKIGSPMHPSILTMPQTPQGAIAHTLIPGQTPSIPALTNPFLVASMVSDDPVEKIIQQLSTSPDLECINALQCLDDHLAEPSGLAQCVPRLVTALSIRLHECTHPSSLMMIDGDAHMKSRICRYVTNALVLLTTDAECMAAFDEMTLTTMLRETLMALVSEQLMRFSEQDQLTRALNVLLVKTLDAANKNTAYSSLFLLLEQAFRTPPASSTEKYPEFLLKCIWKLTKQTPAHLQSGTLNVSQLLVDIERFFCSLPPMEWKVRAQQGLPFDDLPLRTMKTILHELCMTLSLSIIPPLKQMMASNPEHTYVHSYVRNMLLANNVDVSSLDQPEALNHNSSSGTVLSAEQLSSQLADICTRICSKPNTRAGLQELFDLRKANPQAEQAIDDYLKTLGSFFYKYIQRGLSQITLENGKDLNPVVVDGYKSRLAAVQSQMFASTATPNKATDGIEQIVEGTSRLMSPVRTRLESPIVKRTSLGGTPNAATQMPSPARDSGIVSLKERLAKLRQNP